MFIDRKRLKLYDDTVMLCIPKRTKEKLRKIAYKEKITMSEYIRQLINLAIVCNALNNLDNKKVSTNKNIDKALTLLGGTFND